MTDTRSRRERRKPKMGSHSEQRGSGDHSALVAEIEAQPSAQEVAAQSAICRWSEPVPIPVRPVKSEGEG